MLVNELGLAGAIAAPGYPAEYLLLQVWALLYRFIRMMKIMGFQSYNFLHTDKLLAALAIYR
ncbi:MAG: hypothetical protein RQ899_06750 [Pseudomonadales bacterium]|nr:hypothetical protein [Pseudomonadales bacterium]